MNSKRRIWPTPVAILVISLLSSSLLIRKTVQASNEFYLTGTVTSSTGEKMEGVAVSAKAAQKTITTTVFTDQKGKYYFPPIAAGRYKVWAQADTFGTAKSEIELNTTIRKDFVLTPLKEFTQQLTGDEIVDGLPENTPGDRRMKQVFEHTCTNCHQPGFILQNRFDEDGWRSVLKLMEHITVDGTFSGQDQAPDPIIKYHESELAAYLARARGPGPSPLELHLRLRPTGEAARPVFQEYEVPVDWSWDKKIMGHSGSNDGSDWSLGYPSSLNGMRGVHDAQADMNENLWFTFTHGAESSDRTIGRIDAKTGEVRDFSFPGVHPGLVAGGHGIAMDQNGILWFNLAYGGVTTGERPAGKLGRMDPNTFEMTSYSVPKGMEGTGGAGTVDVDPQGFVWVTSDTGALRFDPTKHEFKEFDSPTQISSDGPGTTYGLAADSQGNAWWGQLGIDIVGKSDVETGKSHQVTLTGIPGQWDLLSQEEKELYDLAGSQWMVTKPGHQGPRQLGGDHHGDFMWICDYWGGDFAKINIHTNKVEYIQFPRKYVAPYAAVVDRNHNVWASEKDADRIVKYDPTKNTWVEFRLPTLGADPRWVSLLEKNDGSMQVVIPYFRTSKVARMIPRTEAEMEALQRQVEQALQ